MTRQRFIWSSLVSVAMVVTLSAQTPKPEFELASVRALPQSIGLPPGFAVNPRRTGDRLTWTTTLYRLIRYAHKLPDWRISGIESEQVFYVVDARVKTAATPEDVRSMLRQLLVERFRLTAHTKVEERSGYALVVGKGRAKVQSAAADGTPPPMPEYWSFQPVDAFAGFLVTSAEGKGIAAITGRGVAISELADALSAEIGAFVIDKTGLTGKVYFGFTFQRLDYVNTDAPDARSIYDALEHEVGLKLEKQRGPVEFLVVDHVEKTPTEN